MAGHWLRRRFGRAALLLMLTILSPVAAAADVCAETDPSRATTLGDRISAIACRENTLWYRPFINLQGQLASTTLAEAETDLLQDGVTPAWKRVAEYWRGSGLLWGMSSFPGAAACARAVNADFGSPDCRAFLVDRPWSAAFVSFVLVRAGVPGFNPSARHIDYVRDAYLRPDSSAFLFVDPDTALPTAGDLLCYARGSTAFGYTGLQAWIAANPDAALAMHCEIVTRSDDAPTAAYLIGGNLLQSVTLRMLALNRAGRFWNLPRGSDPGCGPDNEAACSFNRHDWVVLLKLKPSLQAVPVTPIPVQPVEAKCCVQCVVGAGIPRCPAGR